MKKRDERQKKWKGKWWTNAWTASDREVCEKPRERGHSKDVLRYAMKKESESRLTRCVCRGEQRWLCGACGRVDRGENGRLIQSRGESRSQNQTVCAYDGMGCIDGIFIESEEGEWCKFCRFKSGDHDKAPIEINIDFFK